MKSPYPNAGSQPVDAGPAEPPSTTVEESVERLEAEKFRLETIVCYLLLENERLRSAASSSPPGNDLQ